MARLSISYRDIPLVSLFQRIVCWNCSASEPLFASLPPWLKFRCRNPAFFKGLCLPNSVSDIFRYIFRSFVLSLWRSQRDMKDSSRFSSEISLIRCTIRYMREFNTGEILPDHLKVTILYSILDNFIDLDSTDVLYWSANIPISQIPCILDMDMGWVEFRNVHDYAELGRVRK